VLSIKELYLTEQTLSKKRKERQQKTENGKPQRTVKSQRLVFRYGKGEQATVK
jgi:hypothetical protein